LHGRWQGGEIETLQVQLPQKRADAVRYPTPFVERIRQLAVEHHDDEIVTLLRNEGHKTTTTGRPITSATIKWLRYKHRIQAPRPPEGSLSVRQVRERYGVSLWVVHYWIDRGIIQRCSASRMRHMRSRSITNWIDVSENGSPTRPISIHHPQRKPHEVLYAPYIGIPSGRILPGLPGFGISRCRTGSGQYVSERSSSRIFARNVATPPGRSSTFFRVIPPRRAACHHIS